MIGSRRSVITLIAVFALLFANSALVAAAPAPPSASAPQVAVNVDHPAVVNPALGPESRPRGHGPNPFAYLPDSKVKPQGGPDDLLHAAKKDATPMVKAPKVQPAGVDPAVVMTYNITGTVHNESNAAVTADVCAYDSVFGGCVQTTTSDSSGNFSMTVPAGVYLVAVMFPAPTSGRVLGWYKDGGTAIVSGAATQVDVTTADATLAVVVPVVHTISGHVAGANGVANVSGETVILVRNGWLYDTTTTDASGNWSIAVAAGTYIVGFYGNAQYSSVWYASTGYSVGSNSATRVTVKTSNGTVNITLPVELMITGTISIPGGAPRAWAYVEAFADGVHYENYLTTSDGFFSIPVPKSNVTLWVFDEQGVYAGGWDVAGSVTPYIAGATVFPLTANKSGANIRLASAMHIQGYVRFETGPGTSSTGSDYEIEADVAGSVASYAWTDASGFFSMVVPAGVYILWADDSGLPAGSQGLNAGGWFGPSGYVMNAAQARVVSGTAGQTINVGTAVLPLAQHIFGTLVDRYGSPAPGIEVDVLVEEGSYYTYTQPDAAGNFTLTVPPHTYRVGFFDPIEGYGSAWYASPSVVEDWASAGDVIVYAGSDTGIDVVTLPAQVAPNAPENPNGTAYNGSVDLHWAPGFDGWSGVTSYTVTASPGGQQCVSSTEQCLVTNLTNGTPYTFTVTATNSKGTSTASDPSPALTPIAVPGAPTNVKVARRNGGAVVTWTAPTPNGTTITGYDVTSVMGLGPCHTTTTSCTFTGVTNGVWDVYEVRAASSSGSGPAGRSTIVESNPGEVRYSGSDFYGSAAATSAGTFPGIEAGPTGCGCVVYIAGVDKWPDALAAAAAAGTVKGPVLFVSTTGAINASTASDLIRLRPTKIIVVGGPGSVSDPVFYSLADYAPSIVRYWGVDRYQAAASVSQHTFPANCGCTVYIAYSQKFPDALSGASATSKAPGPALLVNVTGPLNANTKAELTRLKPNKIVVLGGTGSVSAAVYSLLVPYGKSIVRYGGADRYAVAANVAKAYFPTAGSSVVYIASGLDYNGALSAAAASGRINGPLLLVNPAWIPGTTATELSLLKPTQIIVVGNTTQISATVYSQLAKYAPVN